MTSEIGINKKCAKDEYKLKKYNYETKKRCER